MIAKNIMNSETKIVLAISNSFRLPDFSFRTTQERKYILIADALKKIIQMQYLESNLYKWESTDWLLRKQHPNNKNSPVYTILARTLSSQLCQLVDRNRYKAFWKKNRKWGNNIPSTYIVWVYKAFFSERCLVML